MTALLLAAFILLLAPSYAEGIAMKVVGLVLATLVCLSDCTNQRLMDEKKTYHPCADKKCMSYISLQEQVRCCSCNVKPLWKNIGKLEIHIKDNTSSDVIGDPTKHYDNYTVEYENGSLTIFPENICNYTTIVKINLSFNRIVSLGNLSCLRNLDTLLLRGNRIQFLSNVTFVNMKYLRVVDLSYNKLEKIEPGILLNMDGHLFHFDASHNLLRSLDVTNVLWTKQPYFCETDFSYNKISLITNKLNWTCESHTEFGYGGLVNVSNNQISTITDYAKLGLKKLTFLGKLLSYNYGFDLRWNPWNCDCKLYPFAVMARLLLRNYDYDYFNISCTSPPELNGTYLKNLVKKLDLMNCNISMAGKCPPKCNCFYQPYFQRTIVDCSNTNKIRLPSVLPDHNNLTVNFSRNNIEELDQTCSIEDNATCNKYFERINELDLSFNKIKTLSRQFVSLIINVTLIRLAGNELVALPRFLQVIPACSVHLGQIVLHCACGDIWLQNWLSQSETCFHNTHVLCRSNGNLKSVLDMTRKSIGCEINNYVSSRIALYLGLCCVLCLLFSSVMFSFRFHIMILLRPSVKRFWKTNMASDCDYDVYVSCNETDEILCQWLTFSLVPYLERKNLRVFLPFRDLTLGGNRDNETIDVMSRSCNYLIILSEKYPKHLKVWIQNEWKYAWYNYKHDINREILILNYDMIENRAVSKRHLGAFLSLGKFLDFSNRNHMINEEITSMLQKMQPIMRKGYQDDDMHFEDEELPLLTTNAQR